MKSKASEKPLQFVQGMLGNLYHNPRGYVQTVGELNSLLLFVHHLWAGIADREREYLLVGTSLYTQDFAETVEGIRSQSINNADAHRIVADRWKQIDSAMGLDASPDEYDQFI